MISKVQNVCEKSQHSCEKYMVQGNHKRTVTEIDGIDRIDEGWV